MSLPKPSSRYPTALGQIIDSGRPIVGLHDQIHADLEMAPHQHPRGQLAYAAEGVIRVYTEAGSWVIPPSQAVWIPGNMQHQTQAQNAAELRHLFIDPFFLDRLPQECSVVEVSSLLRELIMRVAGFGLNYPVDGAEARLCAVILDELSELKSSELHLPGATDRRLQRVMHLMLQCPSAETDLPALAEEVGASERTLSRLFVRETGMNFQQWRRQMLLQEAVKRMGEGQSVTQVALELGYGSSSAFVAMFRRTMGKPPAQYFREVKRPAG